jgi:hypothetical protein
VVLWSPEEVPDYLMALELERFVAHPLLLSERISRKLAVIEPIRSERGTGERSIPLKMSVTWRPMTPYLVLGL